MDSHAHTQTFDSDLLDHARTRRPVAALLLLGKEARDWTWPWDLEEEGKEGS